MKLYAIVDEEGKVARHKGKMGIFTDIDMLKRHAWRYTRYTGKKDINYQIAELKIDKTYELVEKD